MSVTTSRREICMLSGSASCRNYSIRKILTNLHRFATPHWQQHIKNRWDCSRRCRLVWNFSLSTTFRGNCESSKRSSHQALLRAQQIEWQTFASVASAVVNKSAITQPRSYSLHQLNFTMNIKFFTRPNWILLNALGKFVFFNGAKGGEGLQKIWLKLGILVWKLTKIFIKWTTVQWNCDRLTNLQNKFLTIKHCGRKLEPTALAWRNFKTAVHLLKILIDNVHCSLPASLETDPENREF